MRKNKYLFIYLILITAVFMVFFIKSRHKAAKNNFTEEVKPVIGNIQLTITTTGVIEPQNRLKIIPSIGGRIEDILVAEGNKVKKGDILAWMSSTDRAALIDAARAQGEEVLKYWEDVYKKTPIVSPIDAEVIVRSVEPGQTITINDSIVVLSDRLIISAQFDETDIGRIKVGQEALITFDAYPEVKIKGVVDHIAYESEVVNNVNIYNVDIVPTEVPEFLRSGMSVNAEVIEKEHKNVMVVPLKTVYYQDNKAFVQIKKAPHNTIQEREVTVGLSDEKNIEVLHGLTSNDVLIIQDHEYIFKKKETKKNPFIPNRR
ncbi:MAG: efflux RND transporter periplasmic adaptor subunit [Candidatus Omnitrophica bacterium]|jgi:macrolide-specific efflux system membrane fusion protein|nr:efflux RND transporter periplasmic adaptor subunit [Candidatus Omnitrophota bacterium]